MYGNEAAKRVSNLDDLDAWGTRLAEVFKEQQAGEEKYGEIVVSDNKTQKHYSVSIAPILNNRNIRVGKVVLLHDITDRKRFETRLQEMAMYDQLTGLPNRHLLFDRFLQMKGRSLRNAKKIALMFIDLDHFKTINDTYGHDVGDKTLVIVADVLTNNLRKSDTVARISGDEFVGLIEEFESNETALEKAENILSNLRSIKMVDGNPVELSASIGISIYPDDGEDIESLMIMADKRMYSVKKIGKSGVSSI